MADKRIPAAAIRRVWMDETRTSAQCAAEVGLTRAQLWKRAKALGLPPRKMGQKFRLQDVELFRRLWSEGETVLKIGERFGLSCSAVGYQVRRLGLPKRLPGLWQPNTRLADLLRLPGTLNPKEFSELWLSGVAKADIAQHFDVSLQTVSSTRKAFGLPSRRHAGRPISMAAYREIKLAQTMSEDAMQVQNQLRLAEMVDQVRFQRRAA